MARLRQSTGALGLSDGTSFTILLIITLFTTSSQEFRFIKRKKRPMQFDQFWEGSIVRQKVSGFSGHLSIHSDVANLSPINQPRTEAYRGFFIGQILRKHATFDCLPLSKPMTQVFLSGVKHPWMRSVPRYYIGFRYVL